MIGISIGVSVGSLTLTASSGPSEPAAPVIASVTISPEALRVGDTATASVSWAGYPRTGVSYQWTLDGANITDATAQTYLTDAEGALRAVVSIDNGEGTATATSDPVTILPALAAPVFTTPASITPSSGAVGTVFTLSEGVATGVPAPTLTGVLTLDGIDVTPAGLSYTSTAEGALVWTVTASGTAPDAASMASATVTAGLGAFTTNMWSLSALSSPGENQLEVGIAEIPTAEAGESLLRVEYRVNGGAAVFLGDAEIIQADITVPAGLSADVQLRAVFTNGASDWSDTKTATPLFGAGAPAAMSAPSLALTPEAWSVTATLAAAPADGGSTITGYDLRYWRVGATYVETGVDEDGMPFEVEVADWRVVEGVASPVATPSLDAGVDYEVQTRAVNAVGAGPWSPSATITSRAALAEYLPALATGEGRDVDDAGGSTITPNPWSNLVGGRLTVSTFNVKGATGPGGLDDASKGTTIFANGTQLNPSGSGAVRGSWFDAGVSDGRLTVRAAGKSGQKVILLTALDTDGTSGGTSGVALHLTFDTTGFNLLLYTYVDGVAVASATEVDGTVTITNGERISRSRQTYYPPTSSDLVSWQAEDIATDPIMPKWVTLHLVRRENKLWLYSGEWEERIERAAFTIEDDYWQAGSTGAPDNLVKAPFPHLNSTKWGVGGRNATSDMRIDFVALNSSAGVGTAGLSAVPITTSGADQPLVVSYSTPSAVVEDVVGQPTWKDVRVQLPLTIENENVAGATAAMLAGFKDGGEYLNAFEKPFVLKGTLDTANVKAGVPIHVGVWTSSNMGATSIIASTVIYADGAEHAFELPFMSDTTREIFYGGVLMPGPTQRYDFLSKNTWTPGPDLSDVARLKDLRFVDVTHASTLVAPGAQAATASDTIDDRGVIWKFYSDAAKTTPLAVTYGRYANGDYWVQRPAVGDLFVDEEGPFRYRERRFTVYRERGDTGAILRNHTILYNGSNVWSDRDDTGAIVPGGVTLADIAGFESGFFVGGCGTVVDYRPDVGGASFQRYPQRSSDGALSKTQWVNNYSGYFSSNNVSPGATGALYQATADVTLTKNVTVLEPLGEGDYQHNYRSASYRHLTLVASAPAADSFRPYHGLLDKTPPATLAQLRARLARIPTLDPNPALAVATTRGRDFVQFSPDATTRNNSTQIGLIPFLSGEPYGRDLSKAHDANIWYPLLTTQADQRGAGSDWERLVVGAVQLGLDLIYSNLISSRTWAGGGANKYRRPFAALAATLLEDAADNSDPTSLRGIMIAGATQFDASTQVPMDRTVVPFSGEIAKLAVGQSYAGKIFPFPGDLMTGIIPIEQAVADRTPYLEAKVAYNSARDAWLADPAGVDSNGVPLVDKYDAALTALNMRPSAEMFKFHAGRVDVQNATTVDPKPWDTPTDGNIAWKSSYKLNDLAAQITAHLAMRRIDEAESVFANTATLDWFDLFHVTERRVTLEPGSVLGDGVTVGDVFDNNDLPPPALRSFYGTHRNPAGGPIPVHGMGALECGKWDKTLVAEFYSAWFYANYPEVADYANDPVGTIGQTFDYWRDLIAISAFGVPQLRVWTRGAAVSYFAASDLFGVKVGGAEAWIDGALPTSYALTSGTLPTGLTLDTTTGAISGTVDAGATLTAGDPYEKGFDPASYLPGYDEVEITATNANGAAAAKLRFRVE